MAKDKDEDYVLSQTGSEGDTAAQEEEVDPYDQEIADLGPAPGPGSSAAVCDEYNYAVAEIEQRRGEELAQQQLEAQEAERDAQGELSSTSEDKEGRLVGVTPQPGGDRGKWTPETDLRYARSTGGSGDDGTGTAPGT